jgi:hypothetical protein
VYGRKETQMDVYYSLRYLTNADIERSADNLRKSNKRNYIIIALGILFHVVCISLYVMLFFRIVSNFAGKQYTTYSEELIVSTIATTTTSTTTTTTTTTTTKVTTVTTTETTTTTTTTEPVIEELPPGEYRLPGWEGEVLTSTNGNIQGPSGRETYYNLPMEGVVSVMRNMGFDEENYPYWVRDDGVKMLGNYIMCAADLNLRPRGSVVESSRGLALVCDTGGFAEFNHEQLDIATSW